MQLKLNIGLNQLPIFLCLHQQFIFTSTIYIIGYVLVSKPILDNKTKVFRFSKGIFLYLVLPAESLGKLVTLFKK